MRRPLEGPNSCLIDFSVLLEGQLTLWIEFRIKVLIPGSAQTLRPKEQATQICEPFRRNTQTPHGAAGFDGADGVALRVLVLAPSERNLCSHAIFPNFQPRPGDIGARRSRRFIVQTETRAQIASRLTPSHVEAT